MAGISYLYLHSDLTALKTKRTKKTCVLQPIANGMRASVCLDKPVVMEF